MKDLRFYGKMARADFEEKTMTFEIENEMVVQAGDYVILTLNDYSNLVSENNTRTESERVCLAGCFENGICTKTKANCARGLCSEWQTKA